MFFERCNRESLIPYLYCNRRNGFLESQQSVDSFGEAYSQSKPLLPVVSCDYLSHTDLSGTVEEISWNSFFDGHVIAFPTVITWFSPISRNNILPLLFFCSEENNVLYSSSCQDILYEGRLIARERPLIAHQADTGSDLWKVDLSSFTNDLRCEPSKPIILSKGKSLVFNVLPSMISNHFGQTCWWLAWSVLIQLHAMSSWMQLEVPLHSPWMG